MAATTSRRNYSYNKSFKDSEGNLFYTRSERDTSTRKIRQRKEEERLRKREERLRKEARSVRTVRDTAFTAASDGLVTPIDAPSGRNLFVPVQPLTKPVTDAVSALPTKLQPFVRDLARDTATNQAMMMLMERASEFSTPTAAMLAGIALDPVARKRFDAFLDDGWRGKGIPKVAGEVIVGGGLHAAIYAAVRFAQGHPAPLVLERRSRVGGAFGVSANPSFYLNSRNRPGPLSVPGEMGALNVLPGSMVQPSDLGGAEYQTNDSLGWVVRLMLAMNANVISDVEVDQIMPNRDGTFEIRLVSGERINAKRVILATGVNEPLEVTGLSSDRVMSYEQFMRRMDDPFALRGMDRIAVLGGGDGGKTVIEALSGQGPLRQFSVATLDYPQKIDWYGAPFFTCEDFGQIVRPRYRNIARLLPSSTNRGRPFRVTPKPAADYYAEGFNSVFVNEVPYDYIVQSVGYSMGTTVQLITRDDNDTFSIEPKSRGGRSIGQRGRYREGALAAFTDLDLYIIGPAANLPISASETDSLRGIGENAASVFRYAGRTAALAANLP